MESVWNFMLEVFIDVDSELRLWSRPKLLWQSVPGHFFLEHASGVFFSLTPSGWPHRRQDHGKGESFSDVNALAKGLQWNWKGTEARFRRLSPDLEPEDKPIILREAPCKERASQTCEVWQMCH